MLLLPPSDPSEDVGDKELQIMRIVLCIWGGIEKIRCKHQER